VIQVIGETSNKSAELKKFVQTFVLAQQPTGYFVLNDIFRYINDEGEEELVDNTQDDSAATGPLVEDVEMPKAQPSAEEPTAAPLDAEVVDKKLEETIETAAVSEPIPTSNGMSGSDESEDTTAAAPKVEEDVPTPEVAAKEVEAELKEPEKPKDPVPSPEITRAQPTTKPAAAPTPAQPAAPPKPLSWANRAAAAVGPAGTAPKPAVPVVAPKTSTPPAQPRAAPPAAKPVQSSTPAPATPSEKEKENSPAGAGWQTAGSDHAKRQNRPQSISSPPEKEGTMGYVRNVTEKVATEELKTALAAFGVLIYFDVNRSKVSLNSI
jgi:hypothetical protein